MAAGAGQSYFGHDEFALIAPGMKTIDDAMELRRRVYGALEIAETMTDPAQQRFFMTFAIVGAGPTGVELAGQIRELAKRSLTKDFRNIDPAAVRVDPDRRREGSRWPTSATGSRTRASNELEKMGVELRMGLRVVGVDPLGVDTADRGRGEGALRVRHHHLGGRRPGVAAGRHAGRGNRGHDRPRRTDRGAARPHACPGTPRCSPSATWRPSTTCPGVCEVAMQGGLHAANTIKRRLKGKEQSTRSSTATSAAPPPSAASRRS